MDPHQELDEKMRKIREVFDIEQILNLSIDQKYIQKYYRVNKLPYSLFHTRTGLIHMGISKGGKFKKEDLLGQARIVEEHIKKIRAKHVLELASGRGAASIYLAKRFPEVHFVGIDISKDQLDFAFRQSKKIENFHPIFADYDNLRKFLSKNFDIVFVIEALCMSAQKKQTMKEVYRILKHPGYFIIFDGYRGKRLNQLSKVENLALKLMEKGLAVTEFQPYDAFQDLVKRTEFSIDFEGDTSSLVFPTLLRFEKLAKIFFTNTVLARILLRFLPREFTYNAISGYLMPTLVKLGLASYFITVLQKKQDQNAQI